MKKTLLIALCFALVFGLGGVAGWLLKPLPPAAASVATAPLSSGEALLQRLDAKLHFTAAQKETVRPLCLELGLKMDAAQRRPAQRREIFEQYSPRIRTQLTPAQLPDYDAMVADTRARHEQRRTR